MRGRDLTGRFDLLYEIDSIHEGITEDLQNPLDQVMDWWVWAPERSAVDDVYDVGSYKGDGRQYLPPFQMPVVQATIVQGENYMNDRGFYTTDITAFTINAGEVYHLLPTLLSDPNIHLKDRLRWRGALFIPTRIYPKGYIQRRFATVVVEASQVNPEEVVNDPQFNEAPATPVPYSTGFIKHYQG